tara:strand:- start:858 stop:1163 length:306 start_codon:yes stop_codon:yes gene_type:complete
MSKFSSPFIAKSPLKEGVKLSKEDRARLHQQAAESGKQFFSTKYQVNVDPEDGVLDNRPTFGADLDDFSKLPEDQRGGYTVEELEALYPISEGRKLTYSKL